jgi:LmbE family N-acetylglucosaminyl deacetylase
LQAAGTRKKTDRKGGRERPFWPWNGTWTTRKISAGGVLIQAARAGHRVVIVNVNSDLSSWAPTVGREKQTRSNLIALAKDYGFEKRFLDFPYHQTDGGDLDLKRKLAEVYVDVKADVAFIPHYEDHWPDHAAAGLAAHDALLFSHGLGPGPASQRGIQRCPLIYAFDVTPSQTYHFEADVYYDVTEVMPAYMDLIARVEAIRTGRTVKEEVHTEVRTRGQTLQLSAHGLLRFADCVRFGDRTGCPFAIGFRTVWGQRRGEPLF